MKMVVITGAGGFLGKNLVERFLQQENLYVIAVTSQPEKFGEYSSEKRLMVVKPEERLIPWEQVEVLIHAAFPGRCNSLMLGKGMQYHANILKEAVEGGVHAIVNISSQSVYSAIRKVPATEQDAVEPKGDYAVGKYASELVTNSICNRIPYTNIRLGSLAGPGLDVRIVNQFVKQVLDGKDLYVKGGKQQFEIMDVRDAADGLFKLAMSNPVNWKKVYNLGNGKRYSLYELAQCVVSTINEDRNLCSKVFLDETDDWQNSALDSELFYTDFNWQPTYMMEDTIREIADSYMGHR
ncbi:MAG: NAD(P)-dependent oxidoreductase [Clostridium sp.]|nr:NAD(P)-dependent oxidoreductase [Clostridium sp.]